MHVYVVDELSFTEKSKATSQTGSRCEEEEKRGREGRRGER